jgi:hypothetical protein
MFGHNRVSTEALQVYVSPLVVVSIGLGVYTTGLHSPVTGCQCIVSITCNVVRYFYTMGSSTSVQAMQFTVSTAYICIVFLKMKVIL